MKTPSLQEIEEYLTLQHKLNPKVMSAKKMGKKFTVDERKIDFLTMTLPFGLDRVVVRPSLIHGNGVFAKVDIPSGELITFYPGDRVKYCPNKDSDKNGHVSADLYSRRVEDKYTKERVRELNLSDYQFGLDDKWMVLGDPSFTDDGNYLGHLINDGAKPNKDPKSIPLYAEISIMKANCTFRSLNDLHVAIVATKDIKANEELFISYGPSYWSKRI